MEEFSGGNCDERAIGGKLDGGDGFFERDAVEDGAVVEIDEEAAVVVVDGEEKEAVGRGGDAVDVCGRLAG